MGAIVFGVLAKSTRSPVSVDFVFRFLDFAGEETGDLQVRERSGQSCKIYTLLIDLNEIILSSEVSHVIFNG